MKNSLFVTAFFAVCHFIANLYRGSFVSCIVDKVFAFFSRMWSASTIVSVLSKDKENAASRSIFGRAVLSFGRVYASFGRWLSRVISGSFVFCAVKSFAGSFLSLNTRFLGVMLCSCAVGYSLLLLCFGGAVSVYGIAVLILGSVLSLFNKNLFNLLGKSCIVRFINRLFDFDIEFGDREFLSDGYSLFSAIAVGFVAGMALYKSLILSIAVIVAAAGFSFVVMYPVFGAFVAVFTAPFLPTMVLVGLVLFVFASYFIHALCKGKAPASIKNVTVALLIFIFINLVSASVSFSGINSIQILCVTVSLMLIYFVICGTVTNKKLLLGILKIFAISGAIVAAYGIMQYLFGWGLDVKNAWIDEEMFEDATVRVYSTLENPNVLGEYLLLALFPCLAFVFHSDKWYTKGIYGLLFVIMAVCLVLTQSRGCWIGFMLGMAVYVTFIQGRLWGLLPLALAFAPMLLPDSIIARFSSIGNLEDTSSSYRMYIWLGTIEMLKDFWLFGVGQGQKAFNAIYPFYSYSAITAPHAHNLYLQIFAECGIAGVVTFLGICVMWFKKIVTTFRRSVGKSPVFKGLSVAIGGGMLAYLAQGMFDYVFYNYRVVMIFWAVVGIGVAMFNVTEVSDD